jgi:two-component system alkaline phosphatase synthesis response regulator PhoP
VATVLIVEDDPVLAQVMRRHLIEAGLDVEWAADGERALRKLRFERPDVVVLDLMIPGVDGWSLLEQVRADGDQTPIIVVSARSAEFDKIHVLEHGADDYLVKPASMKELVARVRVALRRAQIAPAASSDDPIDVPGLRLDPRTQRAFVAIDDASDAPAWPDAGLTVKEFRLLWTLACSAGRAMSRDELQQRVWGIPYRPRDRSVDVCVRKIREKIDERSPSHSYIQTHYGIGYRFEPAPATA